MLFLMPMTQSNHSLPSVIEKRRSIMLSFIRDDPIIAKAGKHCTARHLESMHFSLSTALLATAGVARCLALIINLEEGTLMAHFVPAFNLHPCLLI